MIKIALFLLALLPPRVQDNPVYPPNPLDTSRGTASSHYTAGVDEASHWLNLFDQRQFGSSWDDSGPMLKDLIARRQWIAAMTAFRTPLGNLRSRKVESHESLSTLPHGTKGNFILIHFRPQFSQNSQVTEHVTLMMNERGEWRGIAYDISAQ